MQETIAARLINIEIAQRKLVVKGHYLIQQGNLVEAIEVCDQALEINSTNESAQDALILKGQILSQQGKSDAAIALYDQAFAINSTNYFAQSALYQKGRILRKRGELVAANKVYDQLLAINALNEPTQVSLLLKSDTLIEQNKFDEVIKACHQVLVINSTNEYAQAALLKKCSALISALIQENRPSAVITAIAACNDAVKINPKNFWAQSALHMKASILYQLREFDAVITACDQLVAINPISDQAQAALVLQGNALRQRGRFEEARDVCNRVLAINSKGETAQSALILLGDIFVAEKEYDLAIAQYQKILEQNPDSPSIALIKERLAVTVKEKEEDKHSKELIGVPRHKLLHELRISARPNPYECVELSKAVYEDDGGKNLPSGWKLLITSADPRLKTAFSKDDYFGAAYRNEKTGQIIIAHRGTKINAAGAIESNVQIALNKTPKQFEHALGFSRKVQQLFANNKVTHTGHSLGGALAQLCAFHDQKPAVTFDSPGCKRILEKQLGKSIDPHSVDIVNYLSTPNIVNTHGSHLGLKMRIFPARPVIPSLFSLRAVLHKGFSLVKDYLPGISTVGSVVTESPELTHFWETGGRHAISNIAEHFDKGGRAKTHVLITNWPSGDTQLGDFEGFCNAVQSHDHDPRKEKLDIKHHFHLEQTGYEAQDLRNYSGQGMIPLSQLNSEVQKYLKNYLKNKANPHKLSTVVLDNFKIEGISGHEMVIISHPQLLAEDFVAYFNQQLGVAKQSLSILHKEGRRPLSPAAAAGFFSARESDAPAIPEQSLPDPPSKPIAVSERLRAKL